jgi:hypothetical protein
MRRRTCCACDTDGGTAVANCTIGLTIAGTIGSLVSQSTCHSEMSVAFCDTKSIDVSLMIAVWVAASPHSLGSKWGAFTTATAWGAMPDMPDMPLYTARASRGSVNRITLFLTVLPWELHQMRYSSTPLGRQSPMPFPLATISGRRPSADAIGRLASADVLAQSKPGMVSVCVCCIVGQGACRGHVGMQGMQVACRACRACRWHAGRAGHAGHAGGMHACFSALPPPPSVRVLTAVDRTRCSAVDRIR